MDNNNCIRLIISLNDAHLYSNEISIKKKVLIKYDLELFHTNPTIWLIFDNRFE